jgi:hypothetical protein
MKNLNNDKVTNFINKVSQVNNENQQEEIVHDRDGLFERRIYVEKKLITKDGKQLLTEESYKQ